MSLDAFVTGLYREHFEEVAGLYDSRVEQLLDWESTPLDLADLESRMEAHVDGLVLGEAKALEVALEYSAPEDPSSFYALVALACAADRFDVVQVTLARLDAFCDSDEADAESAAAVRRSTADALAHHLPPRWSDAIGHALGTATPHTRPVLATCIGTGRLMRGAAAELSEAALDPMADPRPMLDALARIAGANAQPLLAHLDDDDPQVAMTAAVGALRRGEVMVIDMLRKRRSTPWTSIALALCCGRGLGRELIAATEDAVQDEVLLALGILGDPAALDVLLAQVAHESHATAAALALFLITGALLGNDEDEGDDQDEDEQADEAEAEPPEADAEATEDEDEPEPPEPLVSPWHSLEGSGISTDPAKWATWAQQHRERLRAGFRYRLGMLASPGTDLEVLAGSSLPLWLRRHLADEFVIRYGVQSNFEVDMTAARQAQALAQVRTWLDDPRARFTAGAWYFAGRVTN